MKNENDERFWNMILFKMPLTNDELHDFAPISLIIALVMIIIYLILVKFGVL